MAEAHPDGKHLVVACATGFRVFEIHPGGLVLVRDNVLGVCPDSFAISPDGRWIVAALPVARGTNSIAGVYRCRVRGIEIERTDEIQVREGLPAFASPFSLRFAPDGNRVLVPNGGGMSAKGRFDDILSIDMSADPPVATEAVLQVADGIESVAFHPSGRFAVVGCLDDTPGDTLSGGSHLAVIDLTTKPMRLLYHLPLEPFPEGIAFTPDGTQLFVQLTTVNRIIVFDVRGMMLDRSPFVLRVGQGPSSMALSRVSHR